MGRIALPPERRKQVRISVAVTADTADGVYLYAQRRREDISVALGKLLERLAQRERELSVYRNSEITIIHSR